MKFIVSLFISAFFYFGGSFARVATISAEIFKSQNQSLSKDDNIEMISDMPEVSNELDKVTEPEKYWPEPRTPRKGCSVTERGGMINPQPVMLKTDSSDFYPYSDIGVMEFKSGNTLQMWCNKDFTRFPVKLLTAICVSGTTFKVSGQNYDFKEFACKSWPSFEAQKTGKVCKGGGVLVRVGFPINAKRFAEQMQICFNEKEEVTRYVTYKLGPACNYFQTGEERLTFQTAGFFAGKKVDKLYAQLEHQKVINDKLGGIKPDKYFNNARNLYLARGHLAAKADFVYGTQQRATFLFINSAPQWQGFNAGNWARLEDGIRVWVSKNKLNVICYSGIWEVVTLPNKNGIKTPLYLAYDDKGNGLIPVPKYYFRIVLEPSTQLGIVFVGVNNPHLIIQQIKLEYLLCKDVSDKVNFINWKRTNIDVGYMYACEVEDFVKKVPYLPAISAKRGIFRSTEPSSALVVCPNKIAIMICISQLIFGMVFRKLEIIFDLKFFTTLFCIIV